MLKDNRTNIEKEFVLEILLYIVSNINSPSYNKVFNLLYLAEKEFIRLTGRGLTGDTYIARSFGPVALHTYTILNSNNLLAKERFIDPTNHLNLIPKRKILKIWFGKIHLECLNNVINTYNEYTKDQLNTICCDSAWKNTLPNKAIDYIQIARTENTSEELIEELQHFLAFRN